MSTPCNLLREEPSHNVFRPGQAQPLQTIFRPQTVAVIGATEKHGSVGATLLQNLRAGGWKGTIYPINPNRRAIFGLKAYPQISAVPERIDLAIIVTPAASVPGLVAECAGAGVRGVIIISAGFKECGATGAELERQIVENARRGPTRIIGPNCLGVMLPHLGFNGTFAQGMARPGSVGFLSQSGALCTAILDWSLRENVGFSGFFSLGSMLDVDWGDLIYYFGDDPQTRSIVIYMESIGDARSFLSAAREVALTKPIIVIKVGQTAAGAKAAASHTGSLTGSDEVLDAAFRRVGVLRVDTLSELFDMAEVLGKQPRPKGPRLAIVTNAGGPGALATDMLISTGGQLAQLSPESAKSLDSFLPPHWSHGNPVDVLGDADAERYAQAIEVAVNDPQTDGLMVILTPQAMTDSLGTALRLGAYAQNQEKPILASWMGGPAVESAVSVLNHAHVPTFSYPDTAARAFTYMWRYSSNLQSLYETPALSEDAVDHDACQRRAGGIIHKVRAAGRHLLTELESGQVLAAYGIPTLEMRTAKTEDEAVEAAKAIGYPVVLKLFSETITHKTDVGGVQLNLRGAAEVRRAFHAIQKAVAAKAGAEHFLGVTIEPMIDEDGYELILGSSVDPQFGPVLVFGSGGQLVEVFKDRALGLPPLTATLARRMMEQTKIYEALKGVRGRDPVNLAELEQILVRFSRLVAEQPWIREMDINPFFVSARRLVALDARIILHGPEVPEEKLPHTAIRPYPVQYVTSWRMKDGTPVIIRPIRPEDEPLMVKFHQNLSERSVYYRYFSSLKLSERIAHDRLTRICFNDYDREIALVADYKAPNGEHEILGVGRLTKSRGLNEAEFALVISDQWQRRGLGTELLKLLVQVARNEKLDRITAEILQDNHEMQQLCTKGGFHLKHELGSAECRAELPL